VSERIEDHFSRFVTLLAGSLDYPDDRSDDLAARLYLSRSHTDRLVRAASGETPARLRRRLLLERAAFRLLTSDDTVLDVAVAAGFSSNEAFTRAFRRAYARTPSAWRAAPTAIPIATPNGVHFHPPAGIRLPSPVKVTPMELLNRMMEHHLWLVDQLVERATLLTGLQLDTPIDISIKLVDDNPTIRSLLSRLVGQMHMWNEVIELRSYDFAVERAEPITSIRSRLDEHGPLFRAHVQAVVDEGRLDETFVFADATPPKVFTYGGLIAHVLTFAAHRRTLVIGALASFGSHDLGYGDPREWVPDPPVPTPA